MQQQWSFTEAPKGYCENSRNSNKQQKKESVACVCSAEGSEQYASLFKIRMAWG